MNQIKNMLSSGGSDIFIKCHLMLFASQTIYTSLKQFTFYVRELFSHKDLQSFLLICRVIHYLVQNWTD